MCMSNFHAITVMLLIHFWVKIIRLILHVQRNLCREIQHYWLTCWPDHGTPTDPSVLLRFLLHARPDMEEYRGPTVVHCRYDKNSSQSFNCTLIYVAIALGAVEEYEKKLGKWFNIKCVIREIFILSNNSITRWLYFSFCNQPRYRKNRNVTSSGHLYALFGWHRHSRRARNCTYVAAGSSRSSSDTRTILLHIWGKC